MQATLDESLYELAGELVPLLSREYLFLLVERIIQHGEIISFFGLLGEVLAEIRKRVGTCINGLRQTISKILGLFPFPFQFQKAILG